MTSCFLLLKIQSKTHAVSKYGFLNNILALSFACLTQIVLYVEQSYSYKVFVMIPHLDWAVLTSSCHPAAIITVGTGSGDEFPPLLRFRLDAVFVLFPLCVDVPQSHCATMIIKIYALSVSHFEIFLIVIIAIKTNDL